MPPAVQAAVAPGNPARAGLAERLQRIVLGWKGAERNQPVTELHAQCFAAAGPTAHLLLPERVFPVRNLDSTVRASRITSLTRRIPWRSRPIPLEVSRV